jgi:uroporphyrin-III C-methyltransferase / precorrin-2 dehydrogenase / sirohydrochlorin ferrochelatase
MVNAGCVAQWIALPPLEDNALMHSLPLFVRLEGRPVILVGTGDAADAKRRLLDRAGACCVGEDSDAALAIVAVDDDSEANAVITRLKARGILVNAVDRPPLCDFTLPAIVDRSPVLIAIGTGGASAGLAKALRIRLESLLPAGLGRVADDLAKARAAIRRRWPRAPERRLAIDAAFDPGGPLDPLSDAGDDAVARWLATDAAAPEAQMIVIKITSNNPDDLTIGQARQLGKADHVYHHPNIAQAILHRARADAMRTASVTPPGGPITGLILFLDFA